MRCNKCVEKEITIEPAHVCDTDEPKCVNCNGDHPANNIKNCPYAARRREADRNRNEAHSQGPKDWFSSLAAPTAPASTPISTLPTISVTDQEETDENSDHHLSPMPQKRRRASVCSDGDKLPALELHVESSIRSVVEEAFKTPEVAGAVDGVLGVSAEEKEEAEERLRTIISDVVSLRVQTFMSSLRL